MTKKKTTNKNVNKNVNKNNINITIHPPKKRTYKKKGTVIRQSQGQPITIINQIPNTSQPLQQPQQDLNKIAYEYNIPRHKQITIPKDNEPRPMKLKAPNALKVKVDTVKAPEKQLKRDDVLPIKKIDSLFPVEENLRVFENQTPLSGYSTPNNEKDSHITTLKNKSINDDYVYSPYYSYNSFQSHLPTTNDYDDIPDVEPVPFESQVPTTIEKADKINNQVKDDIERSKKQLDLIRKSPKLLKNDTSGHEYKNENPPRSAIETILKPNEEKKSFQSQIPLSEGFITPNRRETILPNYNPPSNQDIAFTPNLMERKPVVPPQPIRTEKERREDFIMNSEDLLSQKINNRKETRRKKIEMNEARQMDVQSVLSRINGLAEKSNFSVKERNASAKKQINELEQKRNASVKEIKNSIEKLKNVKKKYKLS
jgi:hypothetical protein